MSNLTPKSKAKADVVKKIEIAEHMQQELGSKIDGMSIDEAQAAINSAQKILDDLKLEQEKATKAVSNASKELDRKATATSAVAINSTNSDNNSNKTATDVKREQIEAAVAKAKKEAASLVSAQTLKKRSNLDIMAEIEALKKESAIAQAEMQRARDEVEKQMKATRTITKEVDNVQKEREVLASKLKVSTDKMTSAIEEETRDIPLPVPPVYSDNDNDEVEDVNSISTPPPVAPVAVQVPVPVPVPDVQLTILEPGQEPSTTNIVGGGQLLVQYSLTNGQWDEDDVLWLCCVPPPNMSASSDSSVSLYTAEDNQCTQAYETLEYTTKPEVSNNHDATLRGVCVIPLPSWACHVQVSYIRTTTHVLGSTVKRTSALLGKSHVVSVPSAVCNGSGNGNEKRISGMRSGGDFKLCREDSEANTSANLDLDVDVDVDDSLIAISENLINISTFLCTISRPLNKSAPQGIHTPTSVLTRAQAWVCDINKKSESKSVSIVGRSDKWAKSKLCIELDEICYTNVPTSTDTDSNEKTTKQRYAENIITRRVYIPLPFTSKELNIDTGTNTNTNTNTNKDKGNKKTPSLARIEVGAGSNAGTRLTIRFPRNNIETGTRTRTGTGTGNTLSLQHYHLQNGNNNSSNDATRCANTNTKDEEPLTIECGYCSAELIEPKRAKDMHIQPLPTGVFDNYIHEFVCSEDTPIMALHTSDMTTPAGHVLHGPISLHVNPADIQKDGLILQCKSTPSLIDLLSGHGGVLATTAAADSVSGKGNGTVGLHAAVVDMGTCSLLCARCFMYVGDGLLKGDDEDEIINPKKKETEHEGTEGELTLTLHDLDDVRLSRHCISSPFTVPIDMENYTEGKVIPVCNPEIINGDDNTHNILAVEQSVARVVLHLMQSLGVATFVLYSPNPVAPGSNNNNNSSPVNEDGVCILLKVLSKEYEVSSHGKFKTGVKISFLSTDSKTTATSTSTSTSTSTQSKFKLKGNETYIPVDHDELHSLHGVLEKRHVQLGLQPSIFNGHRVGYVLL
jgi:hypothetical protein